MRRILLLLIVIGIFTYRRRQFDAHDRANGYGCYAPVSPTRKNT